MNAPALAPPSAPEIPSAPFPADPAATLPVHLTRFVGRERELAEAERLLARKRLLTLTGAGGSGKTRLALEIAARVVEGNGSEVRWTELAPLADPVLLPAY
ncbi:MAG TPA: AAA family ATPase, partial [Longimicrobiaceae bacterium]|nr:AAA family ATPase [Longimicrobiaceae bacterium]